MILKAIATLILLFGLSSEMYADPISISSVFESQDQQFLHPDDAFKVQPAFLKKDQLEIRFQIVEGYYLYKSKIFLTAEKLSPKKIDLHLPAGEMKNDPTFGEVEIYRSDVLLQTAPRVIDGVRDDTLILSYQGCAEDGICYPPQTKFINVRGSGVEPVSETLSILERVKGQNSFFLLLIFFGFGVLLSLTPCVLPMLPILSGILVGQTGKNQKNNQIKLSISYVIGMASTYSLLGLFVSLLGYRLQVLFQSPWIVLCFAGLFFVFGAAMFGVISIQIPAKLSQRLESISRHQKGGTYSGVFVMGVLSALIVGPCVAPPLAAALTLVSQSDSVIVGAASLFFMGVGMGVPLIALGASASYILPKAGPWMRQINELFGIVFFGVGVWFLGRIISPTFLLGLWIILGLVFLYWLVLRTGVISNTASTRTNKWVKLILSFLAIGALYFWFVYTGGLRGTNFQPESESNSFQFSENYLLVSDLDDLEQKLSVIQDDRIAMLELYADWCIECIRLEKNVLSHPEVLARLSNVELLRIDLTKNSPENQSFLAEFGLFGPPALLFFSGKQEDTRARVIGYVEKDRLIQVIDYMEVNK